jgi:hypothetical protein
MKTLTFQSPPKLTAKSIVSLVRPDYFLLVRYVRKGSWCKLLITDCSRSTGKTKHLAAYFLLGLAGNSSPSESDIKGVLEFVGIDADEERLEKLLSEF